MKKREKNSKTIEQLSNFYPQDTLDFHEYGIIDTFEIEQILDEFLEESYINKFKYVLVITGKGNVVRPLVHRLLKQNKFIESFKQAGYYNGQSGALEIIMKDL